MSPALFDLLAILLSLQLLIAPATCYLSEVYQIEEDNQEQVDAIREDPAALQDVKDTYGPQVEYLVIIDDLEE